MARRCRTALLPLTALLAAALLHAHPRQAAFLCGNPGRTPFAGLRGATTLRGAAAESAATDSAAALSTAQDSGFPFPLFFGALLFIAVVVAAGVIATNRPGYMKPGERVKRIALDGGGGLQVLAVPDEAAANQEFRVLKFEPCLDYFQGVTKVAVAPSGSLKLLSQLLPLPYNKSLTAVTLAGLAAIGAPVREAAKSGAPVLLRVLCLGLGGGAVPSFIANALPGCQVDVAELEPAVLDVAKEAMGFVETERLKVMVEGGGACALKAVEEGKGGYDAVVIDCYDAVGNVPEELYAKGGELARALAKGLLKEPGLVSANFLPKTDLTPRLAAYQEALKEAGQRPGLGFSVEAEEGNLMTVQLAGGPQGLSEEEWGQRLAAAGRSVGTTVLSSFDMEELAARKLQIW